MRHFNRWDSVSVCDFVSINGSRKHFMESQHRKFLFDIAPYCQVIEGTLDAVVERFKPDAIVCQCGADGVAGDPHQVIMRGGGGGGALIMGGGGGEILTRWPMGGGGGGADGVAGDPHHVIMGGGGTW